MKTENRFRLSAGRTTIHLGILSNIGDEVRIPQIQTPVTLEIDPVELDAGTRSIDLVDDLVSYHLESDGLIISGETDKNEIRTEIPDTEFKREDHDDNDGKTFRSKFDLEFLSGITKMAAGSATEENGVITMKLGQDMPVTFEFPLGTTGNVIFFLAPRVEGE